MNARPWLAAIGHFAGAVLCLASGLTLPIGATGVLICAVLSVAQLFTGYRRVLDDLIRRELRKTERLVLEAAERAAHLPASIERHPAGRDLPYGQIVVRFPRRWRS